jgi:hypothetical protein
MSKKVDVVVYSAGERHVVGEAEVDDEGNVKAKITDNHLAFSIRDTNLRASIQNGVTIHERGPK